MTCRLQPVPFLAHSLLHKPIACATFHGLRHPAFLSQGTRNRWEKVSSYIRTRTLEEVTTMVKVRQGASAAKFASQEWRPVKTKKTQEAEATMTATSRLEALTDVAVSIRGEAAEALGLGPGEMLDGDGMAHGMARREGKACGGEAKPKIGASGGAVENGGKAEANGNASVSEKGEWACSGLAGRRGAAVGKSYEVKRCPRL